MKRFSETKNDLVLEIPAIAGIGVVRIQPPLAIIIPLDVEDIRIAIGVGNVYASIYVTTY